MQQDAKMDRTIWMLKVVVIVPNGGASHRFSDQTWQSHCRHGLQHMKDGTKHCWSFLRMCGPMERMFLNSLNIECMISWDLNSFIQ